MYKSLRFFNTVKYLKAIQIYYRLFYFARNRFRKIVKFSYRFSKESTSTSLVFKYLLHTSAHYEKNTFTLLNLSKEFSGSIDWNYPDYGKLWTYNLTYYEYLRERSHLPLIHSFIEDIAHIKDGLEPFPISLRGINWIKFLNFHEIKNKKIDDSLYAQYAILLDNLEYHLLGNHLLENGFSLLFGSYYFQDNMLYHKAKEILSNELEEQVLSDGSHFELSPMYHQIMLYRVLDCIQLIKYNPYKQKDLLPYLESKASVMLGWLKNITYQDGSIPLLNDSANMIAPTSNELFDYAKKLNIPIKNIKLSTSGYRKIKNKTYECVIDVGNIGADYIPGHAHADTFTFELYLDDKPFIVDMGLSTYETNAQRFLERSTLSHNTVSVNLKNSSNVWGSFRVAKRAKIIQLIEKRSSIQATHDGYSSNDIFHTREWIFQNNEIIIKDLLNKEADAVARLHFHPNISKEQIINCITSSQSFKFLNYHYSSEFNKYQDALCIEFTFRKNLTVKIKTTLCES